MKKNPDHVSFQRQYDRIFMSRRPNSTAGYESVWRKMASLRSKRDIPAGIHTLKDNSRNTRGVFIVNLIAGCNGMIF